MDNPKYAVIYCAKCNSEKISLSEMKCLNCGNSFADEDIQKLLKEAYEDHLKESGASDGWKGSSWNCRNQHAER